MEALQLKIDGLQWEMNRLDAENRKLRLEHPEAGTQIDQTAELQQAQEDVASLVKQLKVCEQRATDSERACEQRGSSTSRRSTTTDAEFGARDPGVERSQPELDGEAR